MNFEFPKMGIPKPSFSLDFFRYLGQSLDDRKNQTIESHHQYLEKKFEELAYQGEFKQVYDANEHKKVLAGFLMHESPYQVFPLYEGSNLFAANVQTGELEKNPIGTLRLSINQDYLEYDCHKYYSNDFLQIGPFQYFMTLIPYTKRHEIDLRMLEDLNKVKTNDKYYQ